MARLTSRARKKLSARSFVFPQGTKAKPGWKAFPIHDARHARSALARAAQRKVRLTPAERCRVVRAVCKRYPEVGVCSGATKSKKLGVCRR